MSAGLPGIGLGGLFFIVSALLAPLPELVRTARGRSSRERWAGVARNLALALVMIAAIDATLWLVRGAVFSGAAGGSVARAPLVPLGITAGLLALVLGGAKLAELASRARAHWARAPRRDVAALLESCAGASPSARSDAPASA